MLANEKVKKHLETSGTIDTQAVIVAEWNMNLPENIHTVGVYRYRPYDSNQSLIDAGFETVLNKYKSLPVSWDEINYGGYYFVHMETDKSVSGGVNNFGDGIMIVKKDYSHRDSYSLQDCLGQFRPRSGINKARFFTGAYLPNFDTNMFQRPRYYMASKHDKFRYWSSWRKEFGVERGISNVKVSQGYNFIDDAVPFVVYKEEVPANRIVIKMQTNVGEVNSGNITVNDQQISDPFYGDENKTVPINWSVQVLENNTWNTIYKFNENSKIYNDSHLVAPDGTVELQYGLQIPDEYKNKLIYNGVYSSYSLLPEDNFDGAGYLVIPNDTDRGTMYVWDSFEKKYDSFSPIYEWRPIVRSSTDTEDPINPDFLVTDLTNPEYFNDGPTNKKTYREFAYLKGMRIVVETMNKKDSSFDLIEMSPRLLVNVSDKVIDYSIKKPLSDLGTTSLPVGQLLASSGSMSMFDDDQAFNPNNSTSIISKYTDKIIKFGFYEKLRYVDGFDYIIPIKTLYSEGMPQADGTGSTISLNLRDLFFHIESMPAPRMLVTDASLSYAVASVLDYIGFSNYKFLRIAEEKDPVIPYFFIAPDQNVAEVLNDLAVSTQSAMFFDEYNNLVIMSKDYLLPNITDRATDFVLSADNVQTDLGVVENQTTGNLPNILSISSQDKKIFNDGKITYTQRYIQRTYGSIEQANVMDKDKTWVYKPALLWEVSGTDNTKAINEVVSKQGSYVLSALPLNSDLGSSTPYIKGNQIFENIIDVGENVYNLTRFQGLLYSGGEIIEYDAVEYNITGIGNIWISNNKEYQNYFSKLSFNAKIYPTGRLRIFVEPLYEIVNGIEKMKDGVPFDHGRQRFSTRITSHSAGLSQYWTSNDNIRGCDMKSNYLFTTALEIDIPTTSTGTAGVNNVLAKQTSRTGIMKNFNASNYITETNLNKMKSTESGTIQSSALILSGPSFESTKKPLDFISYVYKSFSGDSAELNRYRHFGTRMRIVGQINNDQNLQTPVGSSIYYQTTGSDASKPISISGSSGGVSALLNPENNNGYYFEIVALSEDNIESYLKPDASGNSTTSISNMFFYKIKRNKLSGHVSSTANETTIVNIGSTSSLTVGQKIEKISVSGELGTLGTEAVIKSIDSDSQITITTSTANVVGQITFSTNEGIPIKLWSGLSQILVDDGLFAGQARTVGEEFPTVYDLAIEYQQFGTTLKFYLYLNNKVVAIVDDLDPLPIYNNMGLFIRGSSKCMFENIYALSENISQNSILVSGDPLSATFGTQEVNANNALTKYAMSGIISNTYLSGISSIKENKYDIYYDEFGSIFRECAYFNIRYDRAFPALSSKISNTINKVKGYTVSGYYGDSYGAEFMIFNATDSNLILDETTGNFLRIQGVTSNQDTTTELSVDEYFNKTGSSYYTSNKDLNADRLVSNPSKVDKQWDEIKLSRLKHGRNEFSISSPFVQTQAAAKDLMGWIINKTMKPKKSVGVNIFAIPTLQLGDIVTINYKNENGIDMVAPSDTRFVVYNIEYSRSNSGPNMVVFLSEV